MYMWMIRMIYPLINQMFVREHLTILTDNVDQVVLRQLNEELMLLYICCVFFTTSSPVR